MSALVPVGFALGLGGVVAGLVWLAGADERAARTEAIERESQELDAQWGDWKRKNLTPKERTEVETWAKDTLRD